MSEQLESEAGRSLAITIQSEISGLTSKKTVAK